MRSWAGAALQALGRPLAGISDNARKRFDLIQTRRLLGYDPGIAPFDTYVHWVAAVTIATIWSRKGSE